MKEFGKRNKINRTSKTNTWTFQYYQFFFGLYGTSYREHAQETNFCTILSHFWCYMLLRASSQQTIAIFRRTDKIALYVGFLVVGKRRYVSSTIDK